MLKNHLVGTADLGCWREFEGGTLAWRGCGAQVCGRGADRLVVQAVHQGPGQGLNDGTPDLEVVLKDLHEVGASQRQGPGGFSRDRVHTLGVLREQGQTTDDLARPHGSHNWLAIEDLHAPLNNEVQRLSGATGAHNFLA